MTRLELWLLRRIFKNEVRQGHDHDKKIFALYLMIREACEKEFTEDNAPTLDANLSEWFESTQKGKK